jgi:hypothetical protein
VIRDAREHIAEPGKRIDLHQLAGSHELRNTAAVLPRRSLPKNVQFARPTAKQRSARSV